jgi:hypothetical protein
VEQRESIQRRFDQIRGDLDSPDGAEQQDAADDSGGDDSGGGGERQEGEDWEDDGLSELSELSEILSEEQELVADREAGALHSALPDARLQHNGGRENTVQPPAPDACLF